MKRLTFAEKSVATILFSAIDLYSPARVFHTVQQNKVQQTKQIKKANIALCFLLRFLL